MKNKNVKQVLSRGGYHCVWAEGVNGEVEGGQTWLMYFVHMYENRTMKLAEIVLRRREGGFG
jgi:hypothetical protein